MNDSVYKRLNELMCKIFAQNFQKKWNFIYLFYDKCLTLVSTLMLANSYDYLDYRLSKDDKQSSSRFCKFVVD